MTDAEKKHVPSDQTGQEVADVTKDPSSEDHSTAVTSNDLKDQTSLAAEIQDLNLKVERLDGYREGSVSVLRIGGIILALLGTATVFQLINSAIEDRVSESVDDRVQQIVGDLNSRLQDLDQAIRQSENAVGRAESAADSSRNAAGTAQAVSVELMATATQQVIAGSVGDFTIVVLTNEQLEEAKNRKAQLAEEEIDATIYRVGEFYVVTVGRYLIFEDAQESLIEAKAKYHPQAYILNLAESCPFPRFFESDFYGCFLAPQD